VDTPALTGPYAISIPHRILQVGCVLSGGELGGRREGFGGVTLTKDLEEVKG